LQNRRRARSTAIFYFEQVGRHDSLFRYVCLGLLGQTPDRDEKSEYLSRLCDAGVFLIDMSLDALCGGTAARLRQFVPALIDRCRELLPERILLIKTCVYDASYAALHTAGPPVVDARIPFPGSGQQRKFEEAFSHALHQIEWPVQREAHR
jgi:hypothetical protein